MKTRERGVIKSVESQLDRDYFHTVWVYLDLDGTHQGFGGLVLGRDEQGKRERGKQMQATYLAELMTVFGVASADALVGSECFVLREMPRWNEPIVGLESANTGRRFIVRHFVEKYFPEAAAEGSPLELRRQRIAQSIECLRKRVREEQRELDSLESEFVDWSRR
ncbi:MAG: hypothetical protein AAGE52_35195 [Myxococcota bacterium]